MVEKDFKNGLKFMDKVIMSINKKRNQKISEVTFLYLYPSNEENIRSLLEHPLTKNIITVSGISTNFRDIYNIAPDIWIKENSRILKLLGNCFTIWENEDDFTGEDVYKAISDYGDRFPIITLIRFPKLEKEKIKGYSLYQREGTSCLINNKILRLDDFSIPLESFKNTQWVQGSEEIRMSSPVSTKSPDDDRQETFEFLHGLPSPTVKPELDMWNEPSSKIWIQEFSSYLKDLLLRIFPEGTKNLIKEILTSETIYSHWIPTFTHATANPNIRANYETAEILGDGLMNYCFKFWVLMKNPTLNQDSVSFIWQAYMSKTFQARVSKEMKLPQWLIARGIPTDRMDNSEDLLEAICGTIDELLFLKKGKPGYGTIVIFNLMELLIGNYDFRGKDWTPSKMFVQQLFQGQAFRKEITKPYTNIPRPKDIPEDLWKKVVRGINKVIEPEGISPVTLQKGITKGKQGLDEIKKTLPNGKTEVKVILTKDMADRVRKLGIDIPQGGSNGDVVIGEATSNTLKVADMEAYKRAKEFVVSRGMTKEWKESLNIKKVTSRQQGMDKVKIKAMKKYGKVGLIPDSVHISRFKEIKIQGRPVIIYQIVGEVQDGVKIIIFTHTSSNKVSGEQETIDEYLKS